MTSAGRRPGSLVVQSFRHRSGQDFGLWRQGRTAPRLQVEHALELVCIVTTTGSTIDGA